MAGTRIDVTVDDAALTATIARLQAAGVNLRPGMEEIAGDLEESARERFSTATGPDGLPWAPSRRAQREGGKTLIDSGQLLASLTSEATALEAVAGTNKEYAALHQFGGVVQRAARTVTTFRRIAGRMDSFASWRFVRRSRANFAEDHQVAAHKAVYPARPFLGVDEGGGARFLGYLERHLARVAGGGRA